MCMCENSEGKLLMRGENVPPPVEQRLIDIWICIVGLVFGSLSTI